MPKRKLDNQGKSTKNLLQQIRHTQDRIRDAEYAMENEPMSDARQSELKEKNEHRREDMKAKRDELTDEE